MWRYAIGMLGWTPRNAATTTIPRIPSSRLAAKASSVSRKVTSKTRTGIKYQWDLLADFLLRGIVVDCSAVADNLLEISLELRSIYETLTCRSCNSGSV